jgi:hypothetical protein
MLHSLTSTGAEDLVFLVIYDPPHFATDLAIAEKFCAVMSAPTRLWRSSSAS